MMNLSLIPDKIGTLEVVNKESVVIADLTEKVTITLKEGEKTGTLELVLPHIQPNGGYLFHENWYVGVPFVHRPIVEIWNDDITRRAKIHTRTDIEPQIEWFINKNRAVTLKLNGNFSSKPSIMIEKIKRNKLRFTQDDRNDFNKITGAVGTELFFTEGDLRIMLDLMENSYTTTDWKQLEYLRVSTLPDMMAQRLAAILPAATPNFKATGKVKSEMINRVILGWLNNSPQCQLDSYTSKPGARSLRDKIRLPISKFDEIEQALPHPSWAHAFCVVDTPQSSDAGALVALVEGATLQNGRVIPDPQGRIYSGLLHSALVFPQMIHPNRQVMVSAIAKQGCELGPNGIFNELPILQSDADYPQLPGRNVCIGFMDLDAWTYEDACVISKSMANNFTTDEVVEEVVRSVKPLGISEDMADAGGYLMVKQGDTVKKGQPVATLVFDAVPIKADINADGTETIETDVFTETRLHRYSSPLHGIVEDINVLTEQKEGIIVYRTTIKVKCTHYCGIGSKLAGRHSNKHIIGLVMDDEKMPWFIDPDGNKKHLDMVVSPMTIGGRKNPSLVMEVMTATAFKYGDRTDMVLPQFDHDNTFKFASEFLESFGLPEDCMFQLHLGEKELPNKTLVGWTFMTRLHHHAVDKLRAADQPHEDFREVPRFGAGNASVGREEYECLLEHGVHNILEEVNNISRMSGARNRLNSLLKVVGYEMV